MSKEKYRTVVNHLAKKPGLWDEEENYYKPEFFSKNSYFSAFYYQRNNQKGANFSIFNAFNISGSGGFSTVFPIDTYHADFGHQTLTYINKKREKVVKVLRIESDDKELIKREYQLSLKTPHLGMKAPVYHGNTCYLVMNRMPGTSFQHLIDEGKIKALHFEKKLNLAIKILETYKIQVLDCGLIHADIKPDNIMLVLEPEIIVNFIDYGLSIDPKEKQDSIGFSPLYAAPENFRDECGRASDIFCLARVLSMIFMSPDCDYLEKFESYNKPNEAYLNAINAANGLSIPENPRLEKTLKLMLAANEDNRISFRSSLFNLRCILNTYKKIKEKPHESSTEDRFFKVKRPNLRIKNIEHEKQCPQSP